MTETSIELREVIGVALCDIFGLTIAVLGALSKFIPPATFKRTCGLRTDLPAVIVDEAYNDVLEEQTAEIARLIVISPQKIKSLRCMGVSGNE